MPTRLAPLIPGTAPQINLNRPVLLIGRHPECDVRIDLPQISRRHCVLALAYDRATIRDLGSRHGVRLNGRSIHESRLVAGDELAIGHLLYRYEDTASGGQERTSTTAQAAPPAALAPLPPEEEESLSRLPVDMSSLDFGDQYPIID